MFGIHIFMSGPPKRVVTAMPYSREALEHNLWAIIRVDREEIPWGRVHDYFAPRWKEAG